MTSEKRKKAEKIDTRSAVVMRSGGFYTTHPVHGSRTFTTVSGAIIEYMTLEEFEKRFGIFYSKGVDDFHFTAESETNTVHQ